MEIGEPRDVVRGELNARIPPGPLTVSLQSEEEGPQAQIVSARAESVGQLQRFVDPAQTCQSHRMGSIKSDALTLSAARSTQVYVRHRQTTARGKMPGSSGAPVRSQNRLVQQTNVHVDLAQLDMGIGRLA